MKATWIRTKIDSENQEKEWLRERKRDLDALLDFSNVEILSLDEPQMASLIYNCRLFEQDAEWQSFTFAARDSASDPRDLSAKRKTLLGLQDHLRRRLEKIISLSKKMETATISEVTGTMVLAVHPIKGRFQLGLKQTGGGATALEKEKIIVDFRLIDLVRVLRLKPARFKKCLKCEHIFYQSSSKERVYCSTKCSGAARQARFQKRRPTP